MLREHFATVVGTSPRGYRRSFGSEASRVPPSLGPLCTGGELKALVRGTDDLCGTRGSPPKQIREVSTAGLKIATGDRGVEGGHEICGRLVQAVLLQHVGVFVDPKVPINHFRARDFADDSSKQRQIKWRGPIRSFILKECHRSGGA